MTQIREWPARWWGTCGALFASALLAIALSASPAYASATSFTASVKIPIQVGVFVPCANNGAGELVVLSGTLHDLVHVTIDDQSGTHVKIHDNPQGVSGVGLTTGTMYRGTGVTLTSFNVPTGDLPLTTTFVNNFRIIGQGPDNNLLVHATFHLTINANGTVTATVDNFSVDCT